VNAPTSEPRQTEESASISEPKSTAEKDLEFKKRQQEAKEKAEKTAKEQAAAADKAENCRRAQSNLTALEAGQPMATIDASGQRVVMDSTQREQEMAHARRIMSEACK
jgi:acetate kinase